MNKYILLLILPLLFLSACKQDDDVIAPPITAENTFSCKINGELFKPEDFARFPNTYDGYTIGFPLDLNNWFSLFRNENFSIHIYIYDLIESGEYSISEADGDSFFLFDERTVIEFSTNGNLTTTHVSTNISGKIEVLDLDIGNKIIFEFDEIILQGIDDPNDQIILTEGRANFNLETFAN